MKYYLDITLLPDTEANIGFIWQKVYSQVHLALVDKKLPNGQSAIAVSFPDYGAGAFPLGNKLRLFAATSEKLERLNLDEWLNRLRDYTHYTSIKEVPSSVEQHVRFRRVQFDTNIERLARRRAKRKNESMETALAHYSGFKDRQSKLPFVNIQSLSKGERFRLFIEREFLSQPVVGGFSCYGLSTAATVPWF
ncbi:MAG: type I-F CRISPR-associated endoribonuclease Cas6/Csy4 [Pseudomonadales bacterium]|nr:type I-F CRISPR-associated endoribonuclease Cas6/Csy4 [Pseudomonadales bacterium]